MDEKREDTIRNVTYSIIAELERNKEYASGKATLAELRNSISRPMSQSVKIWPLLFMHLPESFLSKDGNLTKKELAILTSIQLYALHQQGKTSNVNLNESEFYKNLGYSLSFLRHEDSSASVDRRFNTMITSTTFEEIIYHIRQLINLLKSRTDAKVNYPMLAQELFNYLMGNEEGIKINWAKSYYSNVNKNQGGENE